jgi:TatD DNase family protein
MLIDTHAHLDFPDFADDLEEVLKRAKEAGVTRLITIGTTVESSLSAVRLADRHPEIYAAVGIHPNHASEADENYLTAITELAAHPKVVAIGETGLDYYRLPGSSTATDIIETAFGATTGETIETEIQDAAEVSAQMAVFEQHLELAITLGKSAIIHQRASWNDTIAVLERYKGRLKAVVHCFNSDPTRVREVVELGYHVSYTGIVTFKNAQEVRDSAVATPLDRIMVETDCPYLAPVPNRGKRCEPAFVRDIALCIAGERGIPFETFAAQSTRNAELFFQLPLSNP